MQGTSCGGGPLACAVALQLLGTLEKQKLLKHVQKTGSYLLEQLQELQSKYDAIRRVRGLGLMVGMALESADLAKAVFKQLLDRGVIVNRTDENVSLFLPPFIIQKKHTYQATRHLHQALTTTTPGVPLPT